MKLNPFENNRTFYSRSKGITKTVRDTFIKQSTKKVEEVKKETKPKVKKEVKKVEPQVEIKMSGEPLLDEMKTKVTSYKQPRKKIKTNEES
jgi:hypothetical protein